MTKTIRSMAVLAATVCLAGSMGFAQSAGEAVYKANCQSCHGSTGTPSAGIAKMMGVKPASDPTRRNLGGRDDRLGEERQSKMKAMSPKLTDAQIKDAVDYFRTLK